MDFSWTNQYSDFGLCPSDNMKNYDAFFTESDSISCTVLDTIVRQSVFLRKDIFSVL